MIACHYHVRVLMHIPTAFQIKIDPWSAWSCYTWFIVAYYSKEIMTNLSSKCSCKQALLTNYHVIYRPLFTILSSSQFPMEKVTPYLFSHHISCLIWKSIRLWSKIASVVSFWHWAMSADLLEEKSRLTLDPACVEREVVSPVKRD